MYLVVSKAIGKSHLSPFTLTGFNVFLLKLCLMYVWYVPIMPLFLNYGMVIKFKKYVTCVLILQGNPIMRLFES